MAKYLVLGKYSSEGIQAAAAEGFASRPDALRPLIEGQGGTLEAMYFCSPMEAGYDFVLLLDAPSPELIYSMSLTGRTSPAFGDGGKILELKTGEEADAIVAATTQNMASYRPPGGD